MPLEYHLIHRNHLNQIIGRTPVAPALFEPSERFSGHFRKRGYRPLDQMKDAKFTPTPLSFERDIHFGLNGEVGFMGAFREKLSVELTKQGPMDLKGNFGSRYFSMALFGGRVAEFGYYHYMGKDSGNQILYSFGGEDKKRFREYLTIETLNEINRVIPVRKGKASYPSNSFFMGDEIARMTGGTRYYGPSKELASDGLDFGTRWSKTALIFAVANNQIIHFHLDGMGNLANILAKRSIENPSDPKGFEFSYAVTSREFRFVVRHWELFKKNVVFYNGYERRGASIIPLVLKTKVFEQFHEFYKEIHGRHFRDPVTHKKYRETVARLTRARAR